MDSLCCPRIYSTELVGTPCLVNNRAISSGAHEAQKSTQTLRQCTDARLRGTQPHATTSPRSERSPVSGMGQIRYRSPILGTLFSFQNSRDPSQNPIDCVLLALASMLALLLKTKTFNSGAPRGWSTDAWLHAEITAVNCRALERQSSLARPILYTLTKSSQFALFFSRSPAGKPSSNHNPVGYSKQTGHSYFHHPGSGGTGSFPSNGFPDGPPKRESREVPATSK